MADIGVAIAEKLERQAELAAVYAETDAVPDNLPHSRRLDEIGRAFAQVSRAVSLATALEDRIDKGLPALPDDDRPVREREARDKRAEVAQAVAQAIESDPCISRRRIVRLRLDLDRLLDAEVRDLDRFLRRPFHEIEARLRRDLGLDPHEDDDLTGNAGVSPASRSSGQALGGRPRSGWDPTFPSPLAGEGQTAMPAPGESRGEAHGGGCGVQARREAAGLWPDLEQSGPASKIACMDPRTARGRGPP